MAAAGGPAPPVVLDTGTIAPQREAMRAVLEGKPYDLDAAMRTIMADADICKDVVAVSSDDAGFLRGHGFPAVSVIGPVMESRPTPQSYAQRAGMLFVGAIHAADSPNLAGLIWFVEKVLPLIEADLGWETRLTIAGFTAPGLDLSRFENHPRITLRGAGADLRPLYNAHRVFVAPARYALGESYKGLEAASYGVPVIATTLPGSAPGWMPGRDILVAAADDPAAFAAAVVAVYRDETLWRSIRDAAAGCLARENSRAGFVANLSGVLSRMLNPCCSHEGLGRE
jgi:hypothetical protein